MPSDITAVMSDTDMKENKWRENLLNIPKEKLLASTFVKDNEVVKGMEGALSPTLLVVAEYEIPIRDFKDGMETAQRQLFEAILYDAAKGKDVSKIT